MTNLKDVFEEFINYKNDCDNIERQGQESYGLDFMKLQDLSQDVKADDNYITSEGEKTQNVPKNRFRDILPYDYNRVKLSSSTVDSDYINASIIKGATASQFYIATQGPLLKTVNDFCLMIWENKVKVIVMVCKEYEGFPPKLKCYRYWPNDIDEKMQFGEISIKLNEAPNEMREDFCIRSLKMSRGGEDRTVYQLHYTLWPDKFIPQCKQSIIDLIEAMRSLHPIDRSEPICIHCSAGCGRTGTILTLDYVRTLIKIKKIQKVFRIFDLILEMRKQRMSIVQTLDQYIFVHELTCMMFQKHLEEIDTNCYSYASAPVQNLGRNVEHERAVGKPLIQLSKPVMVISPKIPKSPTADHTKIGFSDARPKSESYGDASSKSVHFKENLKDLVPPPFKYKTYNNIAFPNRVPKPNGDRQMKKCVK